MIRKIIVLALRS